MYERLSLALLAALLASGCSELDTEASACTPPLPTWRKPHPHLGPDIPVFRVSLDRNGAVYFNGERLSPERLASQLASVHRLGPPEPAVILETEMGAPCGMLDRIRSIMNERLGCDHGAHCDEGLQTIWERLPYTGPGVP